MEMGGGGFRPYFDPEFDFRDERINPPSVSLDNDALDDFTLLKVDSANKHGILLEMVQLLTDLDLVISKSYISSDGGWFMDVFHVTDRFGSKITEPALIRYIQQSIVSTRMRRAEAMERKVTTCLGREVSPRRPFEEFTALELIGPDRPGLLSLISAVLAHLDCHVATAKAWRHRARVAMVLYLNDKLTGKPIRDRLLLTHIEEQVGSVIGAHQDGAGSCMVRLVGPTVGWVHTERKLHQLMRADRESDEEEVVSTEDTHVSIECCWGKEYSVVIITSKDRPKLLFDTVCTLTDMSYEVSHAAVSSKGDLAIQEYFIRRMNGHALDSETERRRVAACLVSAIERRPSQGLRLKVYTPNRTGFLSDITRVFREQGLSMTGVDIGTIGETAVGSFFVMDTSGGEVDQERLESVRREIGGKVLLEVNRTPIWRPSCSQNVGGAVPACVSSSGGVVKKEERPRFRWGSLLWSGIELFSHFGSIRS